MPVFFSPLRLAASRPSERADGVLDGRDDRDVQGGALVGVEGARELERRHPSDVQDLVAVGVARPLR